MDSKKIEITIDGPSASGKTTVASMVASDLGIKHVSSGLFYRFLAYKIGAKFINIHEFDKIIAIASAMSVDDINNHSTEDLLAESNAVIASKVAAIPEVRRLMVLLQRKSVEGLSFVMDGRDVGSVIFPKAKAKFYLDASSIVRSERRAKQMESMGQSASGNLKGELIKRDRKDLSRKVDPLIVPIGAMFVNGSALSAIDVKNVILAQVKIIYNL